MSRSLHRRPTEQTLYCNLAFKRRTVPPLVRFLLFPARPPAPESSRAAWVHIFIADRRPGEYSVAPRVEWRTPRRKMSVPARRERVGQRSCSVVPFRSKAPKKRTFSGLGVHIFVDPRRAVDNSPAAPGAPESMTPCRICSPRADIARGEQKQNTCKIAYVMRDSTVVRSRLCRRFHCNQITLIYTYTKAPAAPAAPRGPKKPKTF